MKRIFSFLSVLAVAAVFCLSTPAAADSYVHAYKSEAQIRDYFTGDLTAASTLSTDQCGSTLFLNATTEFATTLPAPSIGCRFKFVVKAAPSGASYTVVSNGGADIIVVHVNELETDTGDDGPYDDNADVVTFVDGVSDPGDFLDCTSDGTKWYCGGQVQNDGALTSGTT